MHNIVKRFLDIILSFMALVILLPIFIPTCIILLLTGEHEVFYLQKRIGYKQKPFYIWKFATMLKNSPNIGSGLITTRKDPRVLPIGSFLRKTKLNELPQLINILKGEMSIVGPRPMVDKTFEAYPEKYRYKIYDSKPGLTGIGSIVFRDEEDYLTRANNPQLFFQSVIQPYKAELEIWYGNHKSLIIDFWVVFLTVWVIIFPSSKLTFNIFKSLPQENIEEKLVEFNKVNSPQRRPVEVIP